MKGASTDLIWNWSLVNIYNSFSQLQRENYWCWYQCTTLPRKPNKLFNSDSLLIFTRLATSRHFKKYYLHQKDMHLFCAGWLTATSSLLASPATCLTYFRELKTMHLNFLRSSISARLIIDHHSSVNCTEFGLVLTTE